MRHARTLSRADELRVLLGLAVQPFVTALLAFISFPVVDYTDRYLYGGRFFDAVDAALALATGVGIAGLVMTGCGALPTLGWLLQRGPVSPRQALISGAVLGNVPGMVISGLVAAEGLRQGAMPGWNPVGTVFAIAYGSFIGTASAAVFWWIAGRHVGVEGPASAG